MKLIYKSLQISKKYQMQIVNSRVAFIAMLIVHF